MISTIQFTHGEKACAAEPGKFCRWFGLSGFGTRPVCRLFDGESLFAEDGWIQRCDQCLKEFGETECVIAKQNLKRN